MKRTALVLFVTIILSSAAVYADNAVDKLGRGTANVITSPFELPSTMGQAAEENGPFAGFTIGAFKGTANFVKRAVVGVYEMATFPLPLPKNYAPILTEPEYFLQPGHEPERL